MAGHAVLWWLLAISSLFLSTTVVESVGELSQKNVYRLPSNVKPENYRVEIETHLDEEQGFKFNGREWITVSGIFVFL